MAPAPLSIKPNLYSIKPCIAFVPVIPLPEQPGQLKTGNEHSYAEQNNNKTAG
jgi:hypothetical protein